MTSEKKINTKTVIGRVLTVLWWMFLLLLFILLINILRAKMTGNVPCVFGYSVMNIVSGSMEDKIPQGSYILVKRIAADKVKKNDIICFYSTDPDIYGMPNTHRVVEEPIFKDGKYEYVTKGDASPLNDKETAKGERLIGVYVKTLHGLTAFAKAIAGNTLLIVFIALQACIVGMTVYGIIIIRKKKGGEENPPKENK